MKNADNIPGVAIAPMDRIRHFLRTRNTDMEFQRAYIDALFAMTHLTRLVEERAETETNTPETPIS